MEVYSHASKYKEWKDIYNWDTCKAGREEFGTFLASHLTSGSRVINLNGQFGSGKTQFVRRLYTHLAKEKHPVVYIDVWESDFSNNPLAIICSELIQQLENVFGKEPLEGKFNTEAKEKLNRLKRYLGIALKAFSAFSLVAGEPVSSKISSSTAKAVDATPDIDSISHSEKLVDSVKDLHIEAVTALKEIKEHITTLSEFMEEIYGLKVPIIIIIDELDRCRPTYAVEVLEVVKHFFETDGCTFLLSTNTDVLEQSIQSIYGSKFDSKHYLRRFFDRKVNLPSVPILNYLQTRDVEFLALSKESLIIYPYPDDTSKLFLCFSILFENNGLELRDVDQILRRYFSSVEYAGSLVSDKTVAINAVVLMVGLIEQHLDTLEKRKNVGNVNLGIRFTSQQFIGMPVESFVGYMFKFVMLTKSQSKYMYEDSRFLGLEQAVLGIQSKPFGELNLRENSHIFSRNIINEMIKDYESDDCNYWLWEDHQKVIELSGHIE